jgi:hypothetical protein
MSSRGAGDASGSIHASSPLAVDAGRSGDEDEDEDEDASGFAHPSFRLRRSKDAPAAAAAAAAAAASGTTLGAASATRACVAAACVFAYIWLWLWLWLWFVPFANASSNSRDASRAGDSSPYGFVFFSSRREPSLGFFADGATARDPRDAATGSVRERRRGAVARVCAYRERGGRSGAVQRANSRGFERRERRRRFFFSRFGERRTTLFRAPRPSEDARALFQKKTLSKNRCRLDLLGLVSPGTDVRRTGDVPWVVRARESSSPVLEDA